MAVVDPTRSLSLGMAWHGLAWLHPAFLFVDALDGTCSNQGAASCSCATAVDHCGPVEPVTRHLGIFARCRTRAPPTQNLGPEVKE